MHKLLEQTKVRLWLLVIGVSTLLIGVCYAMVQQSTRLAANDSPLTSAQTIHRELTAGAAPTDSVPAIKTDLFTDSGLFAIVTDNSQHVLASSALLNGQTPLPPPGVFSYTASKGSDSFTWEPQAGVRLATEVMKYGAGTNSGFIITGQSLRQAEDRIDTYGQIALAGWLGIVAWTTSFIWLPLSPKKTSSSKKDR